MLWSLLLFLGQLAQAQNLPQGLYFMSESLFGQQISAFLQFDKGYKYNLKISFETSIFSSKRMIDCGNEPYIATDPEILDLLVSNYCRYKAEAILGIEIKDLSYYRRSNSINLTFQHKNLVISVDLITESNLNSRGQNSLKNLQDSCTPEGEQPNEHDNAACCQNTELKSIGCNDLCIPLCTAEGQNTRQYVIEIPCCEGLQQKLANGDFYCVVKPQQCTPIDQNPYEHHQFIECCPGLHPSKTDGHDTCKENTDEYTNNFISDNPLQIEVKSSRRSDNFFIIIGDWGKSGGPGRCQIDVATKLRNYVKEQQDQGKHLMFIATTGDNFYYAGAARYKWQDAWINPYGVNDEHSPLQNIPWLASMGNQDYGNSDPYAFCPFQDPQSKQFGGQPYSSNQFNSDRNDDRPDGTNKYWLPDYNYYYEIKAANLEVIVIDQNYNFIEQLGGDSRGNSQAFQRCSENHSSFDGQKIARTFLTKIGLSGEKLLQQRAAVSQGKTVLVLQHYYSRHDYLREIFNNAGGSQDAIFAYGHKHDQDCRNYNQHGQCNEIQAGGGGGCCNDILHAGFTAVHLTDTPDGYTVDATSSKVRFLNKECVW